MITQTKGLRDKFEAIQYFGAVIYEVMRTFCCMKNQLSSLPSYKKIFRILITYAENLRMTKVLQKQY